MVAVDDGGQGQDLTVLVVDDGIDGRVANDGQELSEVLVVLVEGHQLLGVHALLLVQGSELNLLRGQSLVGEGALDGVEIVGSNGDQSTLPANVHVELILQVDKVLVVQLGELDIPENSGDSEGTNSSSLVKVHCGNFYRLELITIALIKVWFVLFVFLTLLLNGCTSGLTVSLWSFPSAGMTALKTGGLALPWKTNNEREIPSWHNRS